MRGGAALCVAAALAILLPLTSGCRSVFRQSTLPPQLSDRDFWALANGFSEPAGRFTHSDNLVSNEVLFADTMRTLGRGGGVYIGVGPEQNFTYIAGVQPVMAFIVDVRAENRALHLLYKALFEIAVDRVDFVSRLFSRDRLRDADPGLSAGELFQRYASIQPQARLRDETARLVRARLLEQHQFGLTPRDLEWIDYAFNAFFSDGPDIHYARLLPSDPPGPSYRTLMTAKDVSGRPRSYLSSDEAFAFVKDLQARNLIVPVVGDFGGPTALRQIGEYVRAHGDIVSAFYGSNVEVYLNRMQEGAFCLNLAMLPRTRWSWFIGSKGKQFLRTKIAACAGAGSNRGRTEVGPGSDPQRGFFPTPRNNPHFQTGQVQNQA